MEEEKPFSGGATQTFWLSAEDWRREGKKRRRRNRPREKSHFMIHVAVGRTKGIRKEKIPQNRGITGKIGGGVNADCRQQYMRWTLYSEGRGSESKGGSREVREDIHQKKEV